MVLEERLFLIFSLCQQIVFSVISSDQLLWYQLVRDQELQFSLLPQRTWSLVLMTQNLLANLHLSGYNFMTKLVSKHFFFL